MEGDVAIGTQGIGRRVFPSLKTTAIEKVVKLGPGEGTGQYTPCDFIDLTGSQ